MDNMIEKAIKALEGSSCNEIELTDGSLKVRIVKITPSPMVYYTYPYTFQYPSNP